MRETLKLSLPNLEWGDFCGYPPLYDILLYPRQLRYNLIYPILRWDFPFWRLLLRHQENIEKIHAGLLK